MKIVTKWMFKVYLTWSICADITLIIGMLLLLMGDINIQF